MGGACLVLARISDQLHLGLLYGIQHQRLAILLTVCTHTKVELLRVGVGLECCTFMLSLNSSVDDPVTQLDCVVH